MEGLSSATKAKYATRKKTGGGAIEWTDVDELNTQKLGKENRSLVSIVGGIDSGDNVQASEHTLDASSDAREKDRRSSTLSYTFQWAQIGWLNWKVARELQRRSKKNAV